MKFISILFVAFAMACSITVTAAETGVNSHAIVLGQSAAFSGPAAELGIQMNVGAKLAFDDVNAKGGIFGRRIELITADDGYEPERAAANTKKLITEDKVFALFGYVGTPTSNAALPIFTAAKVPFFGAFTGAESLRTPFNRYIFNIRASYFNETEKIVEHLTANGLKNIAVFYQNDAYGKAGLAGVEQALARRNMKVFALGTVERNTVDVSTAVKEIIGKNPDAVVMISAYKSCAEFVRQAKKAGSGAQFHNLSFVGTQALADELKTDGVGVAITQVVPLPMGSMLPIVREYQDLSKKAGKQVNFSGMEGFIAAKVFTEGLRRAGKDITREQFITALETMKNVDFGGFNIDFSPSNHNGSKFVDLTLIGKNGKFLH